MEDIWREALEYARWAPSPHNTQLWKVKIHSPSVLEVFYDTERLLPVENESGSFMTCGMGVFIEALSIAVAARGYGIEVEYPGTVLLTDPKGFKYFCTLSLKKRPMAELLDRELLLVRRTSRLPYLPKVVDEKITTLLSEEAKRFGHRFVFSHDEKLIDDILVLNKNTLFYDMDDPATRKEVGSWMRYSKKQAYTKKDGLWTYCLQLPGRFAYLSFQMRFIFNIKFVKNIVGKFYLKTTQGTKTIGWLAGPMNTPEEWFASGRMLLRLWLMMTQEQVYLHPFGSIITNLKAHAEVLDLLRTSEDQKNTLWLIMRLGYSVLPPRSVRLSVEDLIIQ